MLPRVAWGEGTDFGTGQAFGGQTLSQVAWGEGVILAQVKCEDALNDLKPFPPLFSMIYALASFL